jgi:hypothetical protein
MIAVTSMFSLVLAFLTISPTVKIYAGLAPAPVTSIDPAEADSALAALA